VGLARGARYRWHAELRLPWRRRAAPPFLLLEDTTMKLPRLAPHDKDSAANGTDSVLLCVYAPFGTDRTLSTYPDGQSKELAQHPLVRNLMRVAAGGVHVAALIDRVGEDTFLVEIPAGAPQRVRMTSTWKEDMSSPHALAGFLQRAHANHPTAAVVLSIEGHGAGFLPHLDRTQMTARNITENGRIDWRIRGNSSPTLPEGSPMLPEGSPMLPEGSPMLPEGSPMLPANHMPMSTWGLGDALRRAREAGVPKLAVLHFNNCFNMSVEVMHTVAPWAEFATGYINYNFFTAADSYPWVFQQFARPGSHTALDLAQWFADGNNDFLAVKGNHPTAGSVVPLAKMREVAERVDDLADALLAAMRSAGAGRPVVIDKIRDAIVAARQLDTPAGGGFELETPDELTDLRSFALVLAGPTFDLSPHPVRPAALALAELLKSFLRYGVKDRPWVDLTVEWNFSAQDMAINILLPDPLRRGLWDWRSPFYMNVTPSLMQPEVIDFLQITDWVDFIDEYHKGEDTARQTANFVGLLAAKIPEFPVFNAKFVPPKDLPPLKQPPGGGYPPAGTGGKKAS
jgi:hypothetical protein